MPDLDMLHTGTSDPATMTFGNEETDDTKQEAIAEQQAQLQALMPDVQFLRDYADREIEAVQNIHAYLKTLGSRPTKAQIEAEFHARELYLGFLHRFKGDVDNQVALAESEAQR